MVRVLLQDTHADNLGNLEHEFLVVGQNIRADQLDDFHQLAFVKQQIGNLLAAFHKIGRNILRIPGLQIVQIFSIAGCPVDGGVVARISKALVQSPEAAHKPLGVLGDRFGKVRALRGNRADDGHGAFGAVEVVHIARALVKLGDT